MGRIDTGSFTLTNELIFKIIYLTYLLLNMKNADISNATLHIAWIIIPVFIER